MQQYDNENLKKLDGLISGIEVAMLTTIEEDGSLRSRPMWSQQIREGELWFFTRSSSPKVGEVERDQHVNLSYADPRRENYVSISGRAEFSRDRAKAEELWNPALRTWFPKGLEDPELGLIRVRVEHAEYWDAPSSKMVHLFGLVQALATGKSPRPGDHAKVELESNKKTG